MDPKSYCYKNGQDEKFIPQNVLLMHMRTCFYAPCTFSVLIDVCTLVSKKIHRPEIF